jgi:hypothetical protein
MTYGRETRDTKKPVRERVKGSHFLDREIETNSNHRLFKLSRSFQGLAKKGRQTMEIILTQWCN